MKKTIKGIALLLSIMLLSITMFGCNKSNKQDENSIVIWANVLDSEVKKFKEIADEWSEKSGIKVTIYSTSSTGADFIKTAAGKRPDIFFGVSAEDTGKLVKAKSVEQVPADFIDKKQYVSEDLIQATSSEGVQYGVPLTAETVVLYYNKDIVKNVPDTMEELIADAKKKKMQFEANNYYFSYGIVLSQGGYLYNYKNNTFDYKDIGTDSKESIIGLTFLQNMFTKDELFLSGSSDIQASGNFEAGNIGYYIGEAGRVRTFSKQDIDFGISKLPTVNGKEFTPFKYVKMASVSSASNKKSEAWDLLSEFIKESDDIFMESGPYAPTYKSSLDSEVYKKSKYASILLEQNNSSVILPNIVEKDAFDYVINGCLDNLVQGKITPEECGKEMKKNLKDTIDQVIH